VDIVLVIGKGKGAALVAACRFLEMLRLW